MNMQTEPAIIIGAIGAVITAAIPLLARTFGWTEDIAQEWQTLLNTLLILGGILLTAVVIRAKVVSPATYKEDVQTALETTPPKP